MSGAPKSAVSGAPTKHLCTGHLVLCLQRISGICPNKYPWFFATTNFRKPFLTTMDNNLFDRWPNDFVVFIEKTPEYKKLVDDHVDKHRINRKSREACFKTMNANEKAAAKKQNEMKFNMAQMVEHMAAGQGARMYGWEKENASSTKKAEQNERLKLKQKHQQEELEFKRKQLAKSAGMLGIDHAGARGNQAQAQIELEDKLEDEPKAEGQIFVQQIFGGTAVYNVKSFDDTMEKMYQVARLDLGTDDIKFTTLNGQTLNPAQTFRDAGISNGSTISLSGRLRGGSLCQYGTGTKAERIRAAEFENFLLGFRDQRTRKITMTREEYEKLIELKILQRKMQRLVNGVPPEERAVKKIVTRKHALKTKKL